MSVQAFQINVPQQTLDDLQKRLARTRWTDEAEGAGWDYGTNLGYMKELVEYWQTQYDWRKQEAELNKLPLFQVEIDGQVLQFIHVRGKGANPTPILLLHGWPDSVYRYVKLIPMLADPAAYGGDAKDSFDVVVPFLFGTATNPRPVRQKMMQQLAERFWRLMTELLGYERFAAAGGDGGSVITQSLAVDHPESIIGIHLTDIGYHATTAQHDDLSEVEQKYLNDLQTAAFPEGAYAMVLGTKPQTWALGLTDSPVGWAALVIEKFRTWSDCDGDLEKVYTKDELLNNIMLYWVLNGIDPRGYREEWMNGSLKPDQQVAVPAAVAIPPKDLSIPPREFAGRNLKNIQRWTILPHGGHFVAMEFPQLMAEDIRALFRTLREQG